MYSFLIISHQIKEGLNAWAALGSLREQYTSESISEWFISVLMVTLPLSPMPLPTPGGWLLSPWDPACQLQSVLWRVSSVIDPGPECPQTGQWETTADWCAWVDIWHVGNAFGKLINHSLWTAPEIDSNTSSWGRNWLFGKSFNVIQSSFSQPS